ncbi:ABC transporter ATP-binding protein [Rhizobium herbae]
MQTRRLNTSSGSEIPAIDIRGVSRTFGYGSSAFRALDNVSLTIRENEFFSLLGPSGCGKTTLLRMIAGFDFPSEGEILLDGSSIAALPPYKRPVNTVFQSYALFPHMTVAENIRFGLDMLGTPHAKAKARTDEMLQLVKLEHLASRRINEMSGGQQQRVALARALAPQPKVLLLDEPLSALDYKLRRDMQIELKRLQKETGITFIFVTHDQEEALTMSDRIAVMSAGRCLQVGTPRVIYDQPADRFVASFIGDINLLAATVKGRTGSHADVTLECSGKMLRASVADGVDPSGPVTIAVRPEHCRIVGYEGDISGTVRDVVYLGTDTHIHVCLKGGGTVRLRQQNNRIDGGDVAAGHTVQIAISEQAASIVRD